MRRRERHDPARRAALHRGLAALAIAATAALPLALAPAAPAAAAAAFDVPPSDFVAGSSVTLTGSKDAGSTLVIRRDGEVVCTITDPDALAWQCSGIAVPNGVHEFTGEEMLADASTAPLPPLTLRVLAAPAIDGGGAAVITTGLFSGTAEPGASIQLQATGSAGTTMHTCPDALGSGYWSCAVDLASGSYQVRARQSSPPIGPEYSDYSAAVAAVVDRAPPRAPTITSPRPGTTPLGAVTARGGGERGALLQLFIDGALACETRVSSSGSWECPVRWPSTGDFTVQALQRDRAGNFSAASPRVQVRYEPPAAPPREGQASEAPREPEQSATPTPTPIQPDEPRPPTPAPPLGVNWGTPTGFGGSLPTASEVLERGGWLVAPLAGLAYLVLVALPLRAFVTHVRPRLRRPRLALTGRNRAPPSTSRSRPCSRRASWRSAPSAGPRSSPRCRAAWPARCGTCA
ncbi:hypothetical protein [Microcella humidisoli]|uniref:Bacterial Ig-like domain-containing protein n=1 Tax=Microcella humidisoli TaxID=2963406 RepID=A0ABY5FYB7_9MICO|nr:hypothetical protein [Microcella humidisoli]UTT62927.1 hypothetical protein NNL39_02125 [Microcella humidisoli]